MYKQHATKLKHVSKASKVHISKEFAVLAFPVLFQGHIYLMGWPRIDASAGNALYKSRRKEI